MQRWVEVWRRGIAPQLSTAALEALAKGLRDDDPALIQDATTSPPPLLCVRDWPVEAVCAIGYCAWRGDGIETVGEINDVFADICMGADRLLGESAGCSWFLNWYDDTPRETMFPALLSEVEQILVMRRTDALPSERGRDSEWQTGQGRPLPGRAVPEPADG